jgi:hypothetical protein
MRRFAAALLLVVALGACGNHDADPCKGNCDESGRPIFPPDPPPVKVGQVDEYGEVKQAGRLDAEIVVFPDGSKFNCVSNFHGGLQCFPVKPGAQ